MRKLLSSSIFFNAITCLVIVSLLVLALNSCKKDTKETNEIEDAAKKEVASKGVSTNSVPLYCEDLENPCTDPACQPYYDCEQDGGLRTVGNELAPYNLAGATFISVVDSIGKWHNESQAFLLSKMQQQGITLFTDTIQQFLKTTTTTFFNSKGFTDQNTSIPNIDLADSIWNYSSFSSAAISILNNLKYLVDNYDETQHTGFIQNCGLLKTDALNLQNEQEALSVGIAVSVAINSFSYWKSNLVYWKNYLFEISAKSNTAAKAVACDVKLKKIGGADIGGAISGAQAGAFFGGGIPGAVAGGLVGAAATSAYNLLGQALQCQPGVVGSVSRWIADWF